MNGSLPPGVTDRMIDEAAPGFDDEHDDDMFDGDEPEPDEFDHQAARWDHDRDLRKHDR